MCWWLSILCVSLFFAPALGVTSELWGSQGEKYVVGPAGRLPDFSYAGYAAGEVPIPSPPVTASVATYGALGDGMANDTAAFLAAIDAMQEGGVLYIPAGRFVIQGYLNISKRVVLRGAGSQSTRLIFPESLGSIYGDLGAAAGKASDYSFGRGFINFNGAPFHTQDTLIASIIGFAGRGTNKLQVSSTVGVVPGEWVSVTIGNPRKTGRLFWDMSNNLDAGCHTDARCFDSAMYSFQSRVASIPDPYTVVLERPLPWNVSMAFAPAQLHWWRPTLTDVGVEGMTFEMQSGKYKGHFDEEGFNAIEFVNVSNAWVQDVVIIGADLGILTFGCSFVTVRNVTLDSPDSLLPTSTWHGGLKHSAQSMRPAALRAESRGRTGHHGLFSIRTQDSLFTDFDIRARFVHDLSVDFFSRGVVWSRGRGVDLNMDHHKAQTFGILWTQLDLGKATRPFESGGSVGRGLDAGVYTTYWNIDSGRGARLGRAPPADFGPYLNFVGCGANPKLPSLTQTLTKTWWIERHKPSELQPPNLFLAQQALRLSQPTRVSSVLGGVGSGGLTLPSSCVCM